MNCWIIGVTLMCANGFGPVFIHNYNTQYEAAPARPAQIDYDALYRSLGRKTNYEYFCGRNMNPMDREMCADIRPRR